MRVAESGKQIVGFLLKADDPKRLMLASGLAAEALGDKFLSNLWTLIGQTSHEGRRIDATALFATGVARKMLGEEDLSLLLSLQARNTLTEAGFMTAALELRRFTARQILAQECHELSQAIRGGLDFAQTDARFRAIQQSFARMHAEAQRGDAVVLSAFEQWEQRKRDGLPALVPTGIDVLDKQTGGLPPKLTVFVGPPGTFKSGLMAAILERQLQAGLRPLIVSLEDGSTWAVKRYLAKRLGLKVRDVFSKEFPDEARAAEEGQALSLLMRNSWWATKAQVRTAGDICRLTVQLLAQQSITNVWIDNARAVKGPEADPRSKFQPDRRLVASAMYEEFAETADRYGVPIGLLAHTSRKYFDRTEGKGPPIMSDIGETGDAEKDVRLFLGLWKRRGCLRITVGKQNEGEHDYDNPPTMELDHVGETALVDPDSGRMVDLKAEADKDREQEQHRREAWSVASSFRKKKLAKNLEAETKADAAKPTPPEPPAQAALPLDATPKPEGGAS